MTDADFAETLRGVQQKFSEILHRAEWLLDPKSPEAQSAVEGARSFVKLFYDAGQAQMSRSARKRIPKLAAAPKGAIDLAVPDSKEKAPQEAEQQEAEEEAPIEKPKARKKERLPEGEPPLSKVEGEEEAPEEQATGQDFFDLDEMEKFADLTDGAKWRLEDDAEESDFDLLEAGDDDDEAGNITFSEFFDAPTKGSKGARQAEADALAQLDDLDEEEKALEEQLQALAGEEEEEEDADEDAEVEEADLAGKEKKGKSSLYEMDRRLKSLEEEVQKLEEEQLQEKSWEMKGEVSARQRPLNSLLEVALDQPMTHFAAKRAEEMRCLGLSGGEGVKLLNFRIPVAVSSAIK
eukprot:g3240.t1